MPEGLNDGVSRERSSLIEAPVHGGRNYNGPKVAKFLSVNTDLHEWRNEIGHCMNLNMAQVKLVMDGENSILPAAQTGKTPCHLYYSLTLHRDRYVQDRLWRLRSCRHSLGHLMDQNI